MKISGAEKMKKTVNQISSVEEGDVGFPMYIAWYVTGLALVIMSVASYQPDFDDHCEPLCH